MKKLFFALSILALSACGPRGIGDPCEEEEDCAAVEGGYCAVTRICTAVCDAPGEACGEGVCADAYGRSVCLPRCERDADCRAADRCEGGACIVRDLFAEP